ncbi:hypothetical protein PPERSA_04339 [Pseudocohnilembus persalinus]|uniref:Transmembrane protein n=1 Tax=Pseudocohnilembus persalinus TaxID=266149 RepID=A0A0V0QQN9_PSEPJ|nr:hypothetical protein PPERSA_04339 [Pseudocohnilembus persalinus]|eukprot:KRX04524.1 hypothetical protein PPERSA_04339 [Pseudocohnilembus persalinus]
MEQSFLKLDNWLQENQKCFEENSSIQIGDAEVIEGQQNIQQKYLQYLKNTRELQYKQQMVNHYITENEKEEEKQPETGSQNEEKIVILLKDNQYKRYVDQNNIIIPSLELFNLKNDKILQKWKIYTASIKGQNSKLKQISPEIDEFFIDEKNQTELLLEPIQNFVNSDRSQNLKVQQIEKNKILVNNFLQSYQNQDQLQILSFISNQIINFRNSNHSIIKSKDEINDDKIVELRFYQDLDLVQQMLQLKKQPQIIKLEDFNKKESEFNKQMRQKNLKKLTPLKLKLLHFFYISVKAGFSGAMIGKFFLKFGLKKQLFMALIFILLHYFYIKPMDDQEIDLDNKITKIQNEQQTKGINTDHNKNFNQYLK